MECPAGKVYLKTLKRCISKDFLPGSKGRSRKACPDKKVWLEKARKCISRDVFEKHYGVTKLADAVKKQKALGQRSSRRSRSSRSRRQKTPVAPKRITPKKATAPAPATAAAPAAVTPAIRKTVPLITSEPKKDSYMSPGLSKSEMLSWIKSKCKNQEDAISLEPFKDMGSPDLKTIVRLGNNYCYLASDLSQHVKTSVERDLPLKDISEPWYRIDTADLGALKKQGYKMPSKSTEFPADHYKLFVAPGDNSPYIFLFLYDERKIKDGDYGPAIPKGGFLGYIPRAGTEKLVSLIKRAFASGRLFTKVTRPFGCCRFHLMKTKDYWLNDTERKVKAMESEIEGII
jgi:hypothetical protein